MIIYKSYYIVMGGGVSDISQINSFDAALKKASISESNLVMVSSIIPEQCHQAIGAPIITIGEIVFCVMAKQDGVKGEKISAGLAHVRVVNSNGKHYGLLVEKHGNYTEKETISGLKKMIGEMSKIRKLKIEKLKIDVQCIKKITSKYATVVVVAVFR